MKLANQYISMHESLHLPNVGKAKLVTKPKTIDSDLTCVANFVFDFKEMIPFEVNSDMDIHDLVDDLMEKSKIESKIQVAVVQELKKEAWYNARFEGVDIEVMEVDHGGKIQNLNAVAITVKLIFRVKVSVEENKLATALTNAMPSLKTQLSQAASRLEADKY